MMKREASLKPIRDAINVLTASIGNAKGVFGSITVYNKDGFMEPNDQNANSYNNVTARKNPDGSITINFGGGPDAINNLPITLGWNYAARFYHPRQEIIDGSWTFPVAQPVV